MSRLLIIGHLAINETHTKNGKREYEGGAGYHCAWGAGITGARVSLVSRCGTDFDLSKLEIAGADLEWVERVGGVSDRFVIVENETGRTFRKEGEMSGGVVLPERMDLKEFDWVHLPTAPVEQQEGWLEDLKRRRPEIKVSGDSFEVFVENNPRGVARFFEKLDLVFVNKQEWRFLGERIFRKQMIVKNGGGPAWFFENGERKFEVTVESREVVDSTGAGEVVAGVFLGLRQLGYDAKEALLRACETASKTVTNFGVEHANNIGKLQKIL